MASGYGVGCNLFKITAAGGQFSAAEIYANKVMTNHHGGVVLVGSDLYGFSDGKGWTCQDFLTGKAIWQENGKLGKGSLVYADGMLYLRAEAEQGPSRSSRPRPTAIAKRAASISRPQRKEQLAASGGDCRRRLYLRDQDVLQCYDVRGK